MFIPVSVGACRTAIAAAVKHLQGKLEDDKSAFAERSYQHLAGGASHNGMTITPEREKEMREMVGRDVDHAMKEHPAVELLAQIEVYQRMLDYNTEDEVVLDAQSFELLGSHLPPRE